MTMIIGRKIGMTQLFEESGRVVPVSVIEAGPCPIVQVKTPEKEGYAAIQIGYGVRKPSRTPRPLEGHFRKAGVSPVRILREERLDDVGDCKPGDRIDVGAF